MVLISHPVAHNEGKLPVSPQNRLDINLVKLIEKNKLEASRPEVRKDEPTNYHYCRLFYLHISSFHPLRILANRCSCTNQEHSHIGFEHDMKMNQSYTRQRLFNKRFEFHVMTLRAAYLQYKQNIWFNSKIKRKKIWPNVSLQT